MVEKKDIEGVTKKLEEAKISPKPKEEKGKEEDKGQPDGEGKDETGEELKPIDIAGIKNTFDKGYLYSAKTTSWEDPKLSKIPPEISRALTDDMGFDRPSKIQAVTIPVVTMEPYQNFIAQSQNGTGKTMAFVLSSLVRIDQKSTAIQVVVICPTRELCIQTNEIYKKTAIYLPKITTALVLPDMKPAFANVMIGTPGSLVKFTLAHKSKFSEVKMLIIDEADVVLNPDGDMDKQVKDIFNRSCPKKQTLLFSATFPDKVIANAKELIHEACIVRLPAPSLTVKGVVQLSMKCDPTKKKELLLDILKNITTAQTIVFVNTIEYGEMMSKHLTDAGCKVGFLSGKLDTGERDMVVKLFKERKLSVLIATNVLARGYDNRYVTLVINLDIPVMIDRKTADKEMYLHRVGRTGRFGDIGVALNIVHNENDTALLEQIKKEYSAEIQEATMEQLAKAVKDVMKIKEEQMATAGDKK